MKTRDELEEERRSGADRKEASFIGTGGAILIVCGAVAIVLFLMFAPHGDKTQPLQNSSAPVAMDSLQCDRLIEIARRQGVVKGDRLGNRVRVDEARWTAMDGKAREALIGSVACAAYDGRGLASLDEGETVEIYGVQSRKRLATAGRTRDGAVFTTE